ncbi:16983_t:CDS:2 [Entrophospora sp. SA101]|nr:16983_t:CDS:2 [Entrophospora sp. SA101]
MTILKGTSFKEKKHNNQNEDEKGYDSDIEISDEDEDEDIDNNLEVGDEYQNNKIFSCTIPDCDKIYKTWGLLKQHNFKCEYPGCAKAFCQKVQLEAHTRCHFEIKNYNVNILNVPKAFFHKSQLQDHTGCHLGIKK